MKKLLIVTIITMSATVFADISIKGDAYFRYATQDNDNTGKSFNTTGQLVRLHITGRSGKTTVKLGLRNDGGTRVSNGATFSGDGYRINSKGKKQGEGSPRGVSPGSAAFNTDYLFIITKIGAVTIKAGDWWDTTGLGLARKGVPNSDQVQASIKAGGVGVSLETGADDSDVTIAVSGKAGGFNLDLEHNTGGQNSRKGWTDFTIKGKAGDIGIAAEFFQGKDTRNDDAKVDDDASLVHLWTKAAGITWHIAHAEWDAGVQEITGDNFKFSPLGVSILGTAPGLAPGTNGNLAIGNVNNGNAIMVDGDGNPVVRTTGGANGAGTVSGIRADMKVAGMGVQVTVGNLEVNMNERKAIPAVGEKAAVKAAAAGSIDDSFKDIIVTRALGKGSKLKLSWGEWNNTTSAGAKISVKF